MHSALARLQIVDMTGIEREVRATVMQQHAGIPADDAATEAFVEALDQRDDIARAINCAEVGGIALFFQPWSNLSRRLLQIDARALLFRVCLAEQAFERNIGERGIGDVAIAVREGQLFRFEQNMQVLGALITERAEIVTLKNIEHLQDRYAL